MTVVTVLTVACGPRATPEPAPGLETDRTALELLDVVVWPAELPRSGTDRARLFGSISGLAFDPRSGRYLAVIDDRQPTRVAWLHVAYDDRLRVTQQGVERVRPGPGVDARRVTAADLEAVVALPDGTFVAVEEGHHSGSTLGGTWPTALISLTPRMVATRIDDWPGMFDLGAAAGGVRDNQGAEGLALTPDGRLVAGLEQPRHADLSRLEHNGRPAPGSRDGLGRLVEFVAAGRAWQARHQWRYPIDPTPMRSGFTAICDNGDNGLTELLALSESRFLALERACLQNPETGQVLNTAAVFLVDVSDAEDVAAHSNLQASTARGAAKTRLLDLADLIPLLPAELAHLDNFEAMAFGPPLPDGGRTLLIVSDDNFRATQKTAFLLLRIRDQGSGLRGPKAGSGSGVS